MIGFSVQWYMNLFYNVDIKQKYLMSLMDQFCRLFSISFLLLSLLQALWSLTVCFSTSDLKS